MTAENRDTDEDEKRYTPILLKCTWCYFPMFSQVEGRRQLKGSIYISSEQEILAFVYFSVESDTFHKRLQRDEHIKDIGCFRLL